MLKAGQHQQALERVNKILAAKPRDPQARFLKGLIFTDQGNTKDAIEIFTKLTQDYPELPEPYNNLAVIYASQGQYDKARVALEQSIRTHPSYATAYENLGDVYAKLASQAYDKALQIDSNNKGAQNKLSLVRELVGGAAPARRWPSPRSRWKAAVAKPAAESPEAGRGEPQAAGREAQARGGGEAGRRSWRRSAGGGERLGAGLVEEGCRCLPRLLCEGFQDPGRRSRAPTGRRAGAAGSPRRSRSPSRSARPR